MNEKTHTEHSLSASRVSLAGQNVFQVAAQTCILHQQRRHYAPNQRGSHSNERIKFHDFF